MSSNVKNLFVKLNWLRSYWAVNFVFSAIFFTIFRNLVIFRMLYLRIQMRFSKTFFTFQFFSEYSFKIAITCHGISWKLFSVLLSVLWRHFLAKNCQHQKYKNMGLSGIQTQLKRLKTEKLVWKRGQTFLWQLTRRGFNPRKFRQHSRNLNVWNWIRSMKFETMWIRFLSRTFMVCCHPEKFCYHGNMT